MNENSSEVNELIKDTEKRYGKKLYSPIDFEEFVERLNASGLYNLSVSTMKRLWGYVPYAHKPRLSTLNALSRYNGYADFYQYCNYRNNDSNSSSFFSTCQVIASEMKPGKILEIGWPPNRYLQLKYLGNNHFVVAVSLNSKLQKGDEFVASVFELEQPLHLPYIMRNGERLPAFIAGRNGGLTTLNTPEDDE